MTVYYQTKNNAAQRFGSPADGIGETRQLEINFFAKWPSRTAPIAQHPGAQHREGGQMPVLGVLPRRADVGRLEYKSPFSPLMDSVAWHAK
jgi:hypothetical protein